MLVSDSQTKFHTGYIRPFTDVTRFEQFAKDYCEYAIYILHEFDKDENYGHFLPSHLHFVLKLKKRTRPSSFRNQLADFLQVPEVSIGNSRTMDESACVQYLIHQNNPDKYQYKVEDLHYFGLTDFNVLSYLQGNEVLSFDRIVEVCESASCKTDVVRALGINTFNKWWRVINVIFEDTH